MSFDHPISLNCASLQQLMWKEQRSMVPHYYLLGMRITMLLPPERDNETSLLHFALCPGAAMPLHSHYGHSAFHVMSGNIEFATMQKGDLPALHTAGPGELFIAPSLAVHSWMNGSEKDATLLVFCPSSLLHFIQQAGARFCETDDLRKAYSFPPLPEELEKAAAAAEGCGMLLFGPHPE